MAALAAGHNAVGVRIPDRIKCADCNVVMGNAAFSQTRLQKLATRMAQRKDFDPVKNAFIVCMPCTPQPVHDKKCVDCGARKMRAEFGKEQFNQDEPICMACTTKRKEDGSDGEERGGVRGDSEEDDEDEGRRTSVA